jgi:hypothetical protein
VHSKRRAFEENGSFLERNKAVQESWYIVLGGGVTGVQMAFKGTSEI